MKENQNNKIKAVVLRDSQSVSLAEIQARIFLIRGVQVMLDRDLAVFYKVETAKLNRQVKRNIGRFPEDFMFQLTKKEWESLKCQIGISNVRGGDRRALPYVFTEQGVSQLSGVLRVASGRIPPPDCTPLRFVCLGLLRWCAFGTRINTCSLTPPPPCKLRREEIGRCEREEPLFI